ncbi:MAG: hypothetical protein HC888_05365 [Candidatus Competibacteraceae bacterium]|nr:hypothetical protein [Candidatus Competibacteraceae bacterium]
MSNFIHQPADMVQVTGWGILRREQALAEGKKRMLSIINYVNHSQKDWDLAKAFMDAAYADAVVSSPPDQRPHGVECVAIAIRGGMVVPFHTGETDPNALCDEAKAYADGVPDTIVLVNGTDVQMFVKGTDYHEKDISVDHVIATILDLLTIGGDAKIIAECFRIATGAYDVTLTDDGKRILYNMPDAK